ncbi:lipase family alpha/beta hydrolase [Actinophytocola glycyrrhizae]|uniref:Lipase family alpha/beta hydrolase n=1 Tax=Actinophytocola glycyrrhizae TaxID=2044873 RepID=A0ABV9S2C1_9PSEU
MTTASRYVSRLVRAVGFAVREQAVGLVSGLFTTAPAGPGVVVVPGFACTDRALTVTSTWLTSRGYRATGAGIGFNLGCTTDLVTRLVRRVEHHVERTGGPVVLVGHSRGGWLSRMVAVRRPDLVRALVMVGSPVLDPLGANPRVLAAARLLTRLNVLGIGGLLDGDCFTGPCFRDNVEALNAPLSVPALAVYSREDRVAPWELCRDPHARCVEVTGGHADLLLNPDFYTVLEPWLSDRTAAQARLANAPDAALAVAHA